MRTWIVASLLLTSGISPNAILAADDLKPALATMDYKAKDYSRLLGMPGFSDELLKMHFQLYQGYVKNTNLLLQAFKDASMETPLELYSYGALKRRLGWEFDGMRLHEFYFGNLGGKTDLEKESSLYLAIADQFGSFENWKKNFLDTAMMRGIGWVILCRDPQTGRFMNVWISEHDLGHLAGAEPLLVLDVWEHAYLTEYGLDRAGYIQAFFKNIDWSVVQGRFNSSPMALQNAPRV